MTYDEIITAAETLVSAVKYDPSGLSFEKQARLYSAMLGLDALSKSLKDSMKEGLQAVDKSDLEENGLTKSTTVKYDFSECPAWQKASAKYDKAKAAYDKAVAALPEKKAMDDAAARVKGAENTAIQTGIGIKKFETYTLKRKK